MKKIKKNKQKEWKLKFAKGHSQENVDNYIASVKNAFSKQEACSCVTSTSTYADINGRPICNTCGKPITKMPTTITIPYWFYEQSGKKTRI